MSVTSLTVQRLDRITFATAISDLGGIVFYFWYLDGAFIARTTSNVRAFALDFGDQARLEVIDSTNPDFDPIKNAPAGYPRRRTLVWVRSLDVSVFDYLVQENKDGAGWTTIHIRPHEPDLWEYAQVTGRLDDLASYEFRIVPRDRAGNEGTAVSLGAHKIVGTPDSPKFSVVYNFDTVTFSAA